MTLLGTFYLYTSENIEKELLMISIKKNYTPFLVLSILCVVWLVMSGFGKKTTFREQQQNCENEGKKFTVTSQFDFTTWKIGPKGNCD